MSRRIDIELTSALPDEAWTWRAAGAKQPKGTLDGSILAPGASVGDVLKVEVEQEIDGITVLSVVDGREKQEREGLLELLPTEQEFKPVIETRAKRDRNDRGRSDRGPRRGRDDRRGGRRDRDDRGGRGDRDAGRGDRGGRDNRSGRGRRGGPSFTPPPEIPQRPKPKRLKPGKKNRNAVLAELPEEQRGVAELALQGMGAVRQRLREENEKAAAEGRSPMPEATVLKLAEDMLPKLRVAEWRDRAEAAQRQMEHLDLRDLRSVVAAAGDPAVARDETTAALAAELTEALATKQEQELLLWFGDVDAALAVGRVIRALRLSSQPPKAGVPFPSDIAQRLIDSTNASLAPMDSAERWIAMLEAAAFSPVRTAVAPVRKPDEVSDELVATVTRLGPALPQVAALFEIEVDSKAPMPKPLRPGPRNRKDGKGGKDSKGGKGGAKNRPGGQKAGQKAGRNQGNASGGRRNERSTGDAGSGTEATPPAAAPADPAAAPVIEPTAEATQPAVPAADPAAAPVNEPTAEATPPAEAPADPAAAPAAEATTHEPAAARDSEPGSSRDAGPPVVASGSDEPAPTDGSAAGGDAQAAGSSSASDQAADDTATETSEPAPPTQATDADSDQPEAGAADARGSEADSADTDTDTHDSQADSADARDSQADAADAADSADARDSRADASDSADTDTDISDSQADAADLSDSATDVDAGASSGDAGESPPTTESDDS